MIRVSFGKSYDQDREDLKAFLYKFFVSVVKSVFYSMFGTTSFESI